MADTDIATLLPCNVVVQETIEGQVEIVALDPLLLSDLLSHPEITAVAEEVALRLDAVFKKVSA